MVIILIYVARCVKAYGLLGDLRLVVVVDLTLLLTLGLLNLDVLGVLPIGLDLLEFEDILPLLVHAVQAGDCQRLRHVKDLLVLQNGVFHFLLKVIVPFDDFLPFLVFRAALWFLLFLNTCRLLYLFLLLVSVLNLLLVIIYFDDIAFWDKVVLLTSILLFRNELTIMNLLWSQCFSWPGSIVLICLTSWHRGGYIGLLVLE